MKWVAIVAALAGLEYLILVWLTGQARGRYGIPAPATSGHPVFERYFRVQGNSVEQLVVFFPGLLLFATYVSEPIASLIGLVFVVGRALYARGYIQDPARRGPGFGLTLLANAVLLVGGLVGALASGP